MPGTGWRSGFPAAQEVGGGWRGRAGQAGAEIREGGLEVSVAREV